MKKECKGCDFVGEKTSAYIIFSSGHTESSINVPLWTPLWAASRLFWNDTTWFVAPRPGTKHLAVVRKNSYFHAPILWTKQRHQTWMHKTLRLSLAWYGRCLVIALPTHVTNKWAYQETHDIFFIIVIHSAHRRHQPSLNVPVAIRTYDEDLHRKTVIPGISSPARYASRTSGMSSSLVWQIKNIHKLNFDSAMVQNLVSGSDPV